MMTYPTSSELTELLPFLTRQERAELDRLLIVPADKIPYKPQPGPQTELLQAAGVLSYLNGGLPVAPAADVIGYGGAAFGGKTYGSVGLCSVLAQAFPGVQIGYFRRTYPELTGPDSAVPKAYEIFRTLASANNDGKDWHFENGSEVYFRYCQSEKDVYTYQSQAFDILIIDEATSFTWMIVDYLLTRNRTTAKVNNLVKPFAVFLSNPGNVGHVWYSQLFDVLKEHGEHHQAKELTNPNGKLSKTYFIPAFLDDNIIGVSRDPGYEDRLMERDADVAKALRYGDWTVFAGQAFRAWNPEKHKIRQFEIPAHWPKWRATDWGEAAPFCTLWLTKDLDTSRVFVYREVYQRNMTDAQQARLIKESTPPDERIKLHYADPSMWSEKNLRGLVGSSATEYAAEGVPLIKANNDRIQGKRTISRLLADLPDGRPGLQVFETCDNLCKQMGTLVSSKKNPEDVDTTQEDHAYDTLRYGLTGQISTDKKKDEPPKKQPSALFKSRSL
jgi:hypothetical protein